MKKIFIRAVVLVCALALAGCDEFGPVFTGDYDAPSEYEVYTDEDFDPESFVTIAQLKDMYKTGNPLVIKDDIVIKGQVTTTDREGNFYRSMYIQDSTGAIELKIGKTGLYNSYKQGQWIYVKCKGLALGGYKGMVQLGYEDVSGEYETAYIDVQLLVDLHILRGMKAEMPEPVVVTDPQDILSKKYLGMYVTVKGLSWGNEVFCIVYDKNGNSTYLSGSSTGIDSWAFSELGFADYLELNRRLIAEGKTPYLANPDNYDPQPYSVSQYFRLGDADLQVRTSGYARFADGKLADSGADASNAGKISLTGIMTVYDSNYQFVLNDLSGVSVPGQGE